MVMVSKKSTDHKPWLMSKAIVTLLLITFRNIFIVYPFTLLITTEATKLDVNHDIDYIKVYAEFTSRSPSLLSSLTVASNCKWKGKCLCSRKATEDLNNHLTIHLKKIKPQVTSGGLYETREKLKKKESRRLSGKEWKIRWERYSRCSIKWKIWSPSHQI